MAVVMMMKVAGMDWSSRVGKVEDDAEQDVNLVGWVTYIQKTPLEPVSSTL